MLCKITATRSYHYGKTSSDSSVTSKEKLSTIYIEADTKDAAWAKADHFAFLIGPRPENVTVEISIEEMEWDFFGGDGEMWEVAAYSKRDFETDDSEGELDE